MTSARVSEAPAQAPEESVTQPARQALAPTVSKIKPQPPHKPPKDGEAAPEPKLEKGKFSHEGFIDKIDFEGPVVNGEKCEIWWTIDGGQGSKTTYDRAGNLAGAHGAESVLRTGRVYIPSKNLITGEKLQDADMRLVTGWLNVDALVTSAV